MLIMQLLAVVLNCCCCLTKLLVGGNLLHAIESAASLEPVDLLFVQGVVQCDLVDFVAVLDLTFNGFAGSQLGQAEQGDFAGWLNLLGSK